MNGIQFIVSQMQGYRPPPSSRTELRERAAELCKSMSQRQAAKELGISHTAVGNLLREPVRRATS